MTTSSQLLEGLRESLLEVLRTPNSYPDLNRLIQVCHALALATLRQSMSGRFAGELHGVSPSQLAYDCIADLFGRNQNGQLLKLTSYFEACEPLTLSNEEVLRHLRRLVGGSVHQALFRIYGEIDPTLGKILRNVKLAVRSLGHFTEIDRFGESCIAPVFCDPLLHLGTCPMDELEKGVLAHAVRARTVPDLLSALSVYLRQQSEHTRVLSIIDTARVFRSVFVRLVLANTPTASDTGEHIDHIDLVGTIAWACDSVRTRMASTYVARGRISERMLSMYHTAIVRYLEAKLDGEGDRASLREHFLALYPDVPKDEFAMHRSRLEYMTRLAERLIYDRLRS